MTYCCGWTNKNHAFLISDAAVTSSWNKQEEGRTSFGELNAVTSSKYVGEAALKINRIENTAITFAGNSLSGRQVEEVYANQLKEGILPRLALEEAIIKNASQLKMRPAEFIIAYHHEGLPKLTSYNANGTQEFVDHNDIVQIGSMDKVYKGFTKSLLTNIVSLSIDPERLLVCALSLAQSYGSFFYLMEHGVGGVCCGIYVGDQGANWQPDLLYSIHDSNLKQCNGVSVIVRDNTLIVHSTIGNDARVFANTVCANCDLDHLQKLAEEAELTFQSALYDYIIFFNAGKRIIVSVEMKGNSKHEDLIVEPKQDPSSPSRFGVEFSLSSKLHRILTNRIVMRDKVTPADLSLANIPFRPRSLPQKEDNAADEN